MRFLVAASFAASVARLDGQAQTRVKRAAFDFLTSPASPGLHLHRLVHAADRGFWSLRVSRDLRIIVHRGPGDAVLCYAGHHDEAYAWAAQRKLERRGLEGSPDELESLDVARERAHAGERGVEPAREPEVPSGAPAQSKVCAASRLERRLRLRVRAAGPLAASKTAPTSAGAPAPLLALLGAFVRSGGVRSEASSPDDRPRSPERDPSRGDPSQGPRHEARRRVGNIPPARPSLPLPSCRALPRSSCPLGRGSLEQAARSWSPPCRPLSSHCWRASCAGPTRRLGRAPRRRSPAWPRRSVWAARTGGSIPSPPAPNSGPSSRRSTASSTRWRSVAGRPRRR